MPINNQNLHCNSKKTRDVPRKPGKQHPDILMYVKGKYEVKTSHGFVGIMIIQICPHLIFHWKIACHSCSEIFKFLLKIFYWQFKVIFPHHHKVLNRLDSLHCCLGFLYCQRYCMKKVTLSDKFWIFSILRQLIGILYIKCQAPGFTQNKKLLSIFFLLILSKDFTYHVW